MPGGADQPRRQFDAWQEWARQRGARGLAYVTVGDDGDARRPGGQEPLRRRARRPGQGRRRRAGRLRLLRRRPRRRRPRAARRGPRRDRPALRAGRRERLVVRVGRRRTDVRAGSATTPAGELGWTAVHHPFTSPNADWADRFDQEPDQALGLRLRHRLQRQRDRRRLDPYPPRRRAGAGVRAARDGRGRAAREVRLPARRVRLRPAAARRHRVRLGPHLHAAGRRRLAARRDRFPEDRRRLRPADRRPGTDHRGAAPGGRGGRQAAAAEARARPCRARDLRRASSSPAASANAGRCARRNR